jgi:hypothetical protein
MFHCVLKYLESVANKLPGEVHQRAELLEWQLWGGQFGAITVRSWPATARRRHDGRPWTRVDPLRTSTAGSFLVS